MLPYNGTIPTVLNVIYRPGEQKTGLISNIRINNTANSNWTIELYHYMATSKTTTLLYKYDLLAGQLLNDTTNYQVNVNDTLKAISSVNTAQFAIYGLEIPA